MKKELMKILITGGNGFIGKNLVMALNKNFDICAPSRDYLDLYNAEEVKTYLSQGHFDVVLHCANVNTTRNTSISPYTSLDGNLRMFFNLKRCSNLYNKMIYLGSGAEYDCHHYIPQMKEEYFSTFIPKDPYGFSKYIMASDTEQSQNIYELVLFGVYGKYEEWKRRFISNNICKNLKMHKMSINQNACFDYLYINDLIKIVEWFVLNIPEHKRYNVCTGIGRQLLAIGNVINEVMNTNTEIEIYNKNYYFEYSGDNTRLLQEIGNVEFTDFTKSVCELVDYYITIKNEISFDEKGDKSEKV